MYVTSGTGFKSICKMAVQRGTSNVQCGQPVPREGLVGINQQMNEGTAQKAEGRFHRLDKIAGRSVRRVRTEGKRRICFIAYNGILLMRQALHQESKSLNDEMLHVDSGHFSHADLVLDNHHVTK
ncbi:hypothetical protein P9D54_18715 [Bacillus haynesii]|uniref:hypothetical protein n=1 Tax=Bacillus haynesii TaxID=1925021 RepID=UPI002DBD4E48|nr:hypothetical protein [Bacillus haynesii]MEC1347389.1 hypothetical protein [Bacillus haynesii]